MKTIVLFVRFKFTFVVFDIILIFGLDMDVLRAEIAKKRKLLEEKMLVDDKKKFFRRGDLLSQEKQEYLEKMNKQNLATSTPEDSSSTEVKSNLNQDQKELPRAEVIRRLRDRGEAITLFGETERDAFRRLRHLEITQPEANHGFRNDFQEAMDEVDQQYLDELLAASEESKQKADKQQDCDTLDESITYEEIQEMAKRLGRGNKDHDHLVISTLLEFLLKLWNAQVNSQKGNMSTNTKIARATCSQTRVYMKPLLRKLKTKSLPEDILDSLTDIVKHLLCRNYIKASDAYLQMAIGNAPWPIGVTMVGIHARTGREKIFSKNVAHVMNDETQRKYIQGLKRLMTKCQEYFPTDPSRCVEYVSSKDK